MKLLFACVVTCLHMYVVGFSFKRKLLMSLHFPPTIFLFFSRLLSLYYLQYSFRFSLTVLLFVFHSGAWLVVWSLGWLLDHLADCLVGSFVAQLFGLLLDC